MSGLLKAAVVIAALLVAWNYRDALGFNAKLAETAAPAASGSTATGKRIDAKFQAGSIRLEGVVGHLDLRVAKPGQPIAVEATGDEEALKALTLAVENNELRIVRDTRKGRLRSAWNLFGFWSTEEKAHEIRLVLTAPAGTAYAITDAVGTIEAGDLDAPLALRAQGLKGNIGRLRSADIDIAGAGELNLGAVAGNLSIDIAGAGQVSVASSDGTLKVNIAGAGDVRIEAGKASVFEVGIAGTGDVLFKGEAVNPVVNIAGAGDVTLGSYTGTLSQSIMGTGRVKILAQAPASTF